MSKVDAMRAIKDARFAQAAKGPAAAPTRQRVAVQAPPPVREEPAPDAPAPAEGVCGHRNMGGKSCSREADHEKAGTKSHRYS